MKKISLAVLSSFVCLFAFAQPKPTELDKSQMDMCYWPNNFPLLKMTGKVKDLPTARVIFSRPLKNNREIFGGIVKYNEMWRLGANEATEIEFFKPVKIADKLVPQGRYTLFCIPEENKWNIILNKDNYCWGNFIYDKKKDAVRAEAAVEKTTESVDAFTIYFEETKSGANLIIQWDLAKATLPIKL